MERHVGIVRNDTGLRHALGQIDAWRQALPAGESTDLTAVEWRNLLDTAALVVRSALARQESRGAHANDDHPATQTTAQATVLAGAA